MRKPSCLISCSHWLPEGSLSVLVGRHGAINPAGKVRCNLMAIAKGYSCVSRARLHEPLRHLVLDEDAELLLVVLVVSGDADHGEAERILHGGVEVERVVLVGQRRLLQIGKVPAVGVLLDERLPTGAPGGRLAEGAHAGGADRTAVGIAPEIAAADEVEA